MKDSEAANLNSFRVEINAEEVVLKDAPVWIEQGALPAQFFQPVERLLIDRVPLIEGLDQESPTSASRINKTDDL